ncbi:MAG: DUF4860 domain-containing protein [Lachnospiraceae bacterium]|nr:DUF4860 domain-containing protein [Lachnospiraceae bacterium]
MNLKMRNKPIVDILFLLALFSVFLISALFIVLFGAKIYRNTVSGMEENFKSRTALSYVTEKMRQFDHSGGATVIHYGETPVLVLNERVGDNDYSTFLYEQDGYLTELTARSDYDFDLTGGTKVVPVSGFFVERVTDSLYRFTLTDENGESVSYYVAEYSHTNNEEGMTHE